MKSQQAKTDDVLNKILDVLEAAKEVNSVCYENGAWVGYVHLKKRGLFSKASKLDIALGVLANRKRLNEFRPCRADKQNNRSSLAEHMDITERKHK